MRDFIQMLENRTLLSTGVTLSSSGLLHIVGTDMDDFSEGEDTVTVKISSLKVVANLNGKSSTFPRAKIKSLLVETGTGDDTINVSGDSTLPETLRAGLGHNVVNSDSRNCILLTSYAGDAFNLANGGTVKFFWEEPTPLPKFNTFDGEIGLGEVGSEQLTVNISLTSVGELNDFGIGFVYHPHITLSFSSGNDNLDFYTDDQPITIDMAGGNDRCMLRSNSASHVATVTGGDGDDTLACSQGGDYMMSGGKGDDVLTSSIETRATMAGNAGNDTVDYSARIAPLRVTLDNIANDGQSGEQDNVLADVENIIGGSGADYLQGNPFNNYLQGNAGNDTLWGGAGNDTLNGGPGKDRLYGQAGDDRLLGRDGKKDFLDGGDDSDTATRDNGPSVFDSVMNIETFIG